MLQKLLNIIYAIALQIKYDFAVPVILFPKKISQINTSFWNIKVIEHFFFLDRLYRIIASDIHLILNSFRSLTFVSCLKSERSEYQWQLAKHIYNTWHRANTVNLQSPHKFKRKEWINTKINEGQKHVVRTHTNTHTHTGPQVFEKLLTFILWICKIYK